MSIAPILEKSLGEQVRLAQQGDQVAFTKLIEQTQNMVTSIALAIVRDIDASEDVAQKAYIAAWQNLQELKNTSSFLPWIRQITRNLAKNFLRDNKVQQRISSEEADLLLAQHCDPADEPEESIQRQQLSRLVAEFVSQLPEDNRELVLLYYREQQSTEQAAALLGITETNARKRLSRIRASLKQDWLSAHGKLLLNTVPTVTFASAVLSGLGMSSPVAAATLASGMASSKTGLLGKMMALLGGAAIGSLMGMLAVLWSSRIVTAKLTDQQSKNKVKTYRNYMLLWMLLSGIALTLAYELTSGWLAPVAIYLLFAAGLARYMYLLQQILKHQVCRSQGKTWKQTLARACSAFGTVLGISAGFAGLLMGLINSGRLLVS